MTKLSRNLIAATLALTLSGVAFTAPVTYTVSRSVGAGSVVGAVETDGTLGVLSGTNILNWGLTLTSANLAGGFDNITGTGGIVVGSGLTASLTDLVFDFSGFAAGFALQGSSSNAWCMASAGIACSGEVTPAESIFFSVAGGPAETAARSGRVTIGSANAVPEPSTLALFGIALLAAVVGGARRRAST